jgi:predicted ATPase
MITGAFQEEYLGRIPALKSLGQFSFKKPVTFFVGENGTGKSTLLEALAIQCGFNAEGGTRNFRFATNETHSTLYHSMKVARSIPFPHDGFFLRAESFYNVATEVQEIAKNGRDGMTGYQAFMERNYGGNPHEQSHGESFMSLALNRFRGNSIFFLDEPEAALSPSRQMTLLARIHELVQEDSQFIIATHSPILMAYPDAEIIALSEEGAKPTPYKQTEHYTLTRRFLEAPERMLHYLLEDDGDHE